jgi:hypothetical protein
LVFLTPFEVFVESAPGTRNGVQLIYRPEPVLNPGGGPKGELKFAVLVRSGSSYRLTFVNEFPADTSRGIPLYGIHEQTKEWFPVFNRFTESCPSVLPLQRSQSKNAVWTLKRFLESVVGFPLKTGKSADFGSQVIEHRELPHTNYGHLASVIALEKFPSSVLSSDVHVIADVFRKADYFSPPDGCADIAIHNVIVHLYNVFRQQYRHLESLNFYLGLPREWQHYEGKRQERCLDLISRLMNHDVAMLRLWPNVRNAKEQRKPKVGSWGM